MSDIKKIKVGVIGTGALGRHHARLYAQNPNAEVVGVYDVFPESAARVAAEFGLKAFTDWRELAEACDALSVAVPATLHAEVTIPLMEMGKHILVEKPIAASLDEAVAMVEAARKNNLVFGVGHVERFNQATDFIDTIPGKASFIEARRMAAYPPARPGMHRRGTEVSVILDLMVHDLDLILHLIDSEVEKIDVTGFPILSETEDMANVRIQFKNGSCALVTASRVSTVPERTLRVFQEDRCVILDYGQHTGIIERRQDGEVVAEAVELGEKNALADELNDFLVAIQQTRATGKLCQPKVTGDDGLKALKLALDIQAEARRSCAAYGVTAR